MNAFDDLRGRGDGRDRSIALFSIAYVAIPFVTFALVYAFRSEWSLTTREALIGFVVTVVATGFAVLLYRGPSRLPVRVAAIVMGVFFAASELVIVVGLGIGGACGGDGGVANALPGSAAAAFCGKPAEDLWGAGMLSVFAILAVGYLLSRSRAVRWPLAMGLLAAGALFLTLANYALGLSTTS